MASNLDKIDHIVVLMMENRSFDNMLGWLYDPDNPPPYNHKPYNLPASLPDAAPMNGYVIDFINNFVALKGHDPSYDEYKVIMECFTPQDVPVISALAHHYAVCDHWHASVPSQTFPNRAFVHSASSNGFVVNAPYVNWLFTHAPTIFNRIIDASKSVQDKIADLARLVESEAEAAKLKTIGEAWKFMKEKLDFAFQYQGV